MSGVKIDAADLLPADRSFYRYPGSLTTPICNEVVTWVVMKNQIEFSEAQIANTPSIGHAGDTSTVPEAHRWGM